MNWRCSLRLQGLLNCWGSRQSWSYICGEKSTLQLPKAPSHLLVSKKRCHSGIFNQYQMLLSNKKKRENKKRRKRRDGCLLKIHPPHWQRNETPNVQYVYFYPHWRKRQSHSFPCSVSDQHKHTRIQVHFYPLEKMSLIRTDTLLSQSNINVQAHNFINLLLLIFAACSDLWEKEKKYYLSNRLFFSFCWALYFSTFFPPKNSKIPLSCFFRFLNEQNIVI